VDFRLPPDVLALKEEVCAFLRRELPPDYRGPVTLGDQEDWPRFRAFQRRFGERGWLSLMWPKEYGGAGLTALHHAVFLEEVAYHRAPGFDFSGVQYLAPALLHWGTEEQKRTFLPPIARGEVVWAQGYSEPEAGSDLAGLRTTAVEEGDFFVINGSKIWTSLGHRADWMFVLARTNPDAPKHRGISFLLVDMKTPGITVRPIVNLAGVHHFNQVFFDNVRVPKENLVGEKDRGWYVAMTVLSYERSGINYPAEARRALDDLTAWLRAQGRTGPAGDPRHRHRLAECYIEVHTARLLAYRVAWLQSRGEVPVKEASISKLFGSEVLMRTAGACLEALGPYGQLEPGDPRAPLRGDLERLWLCARSNLIGAGTSEVQRTILAHRGLGLPRG